MLKKLCAFSLAALLVLSGCSSQVKQQSQPETAEVPQKQESYKSDIVIIGAGGAGMTAAIEAKDAGANVIVLEKMAYAGGNTVRAKGGLNASETKPQKSLGIEDSVQTFIDDTMKGGKEINDLSLVTYLAQNSSAAIDWLLGIGMDVNGVVAAAGASKPRMHRPVDGSSIGNVLVSVLTKNLEDRGIDILYQTEATELIVENNAVTGVKAKDAKGNELTFNADAVIVAAGGFGANEEMYASYRPDIKGFITTNHAGATGDGIRMSEKIGAALVDMEQIQTHPTVEQTTNEVISDSVRGIGAILVNEKGVRFTNEMLTRDVLSANILAQPGKYAYIIFDQNLRNNMKAIEEMVEKGIVTEGKTLEELSATLKVDAAAMTKTLATWNKAVADKKDAEFGRDTGMDASLEMAPYYAVKVAPGVHHTMGGIKINTNTEVLDTKGAVIKGLYAAGEVTGGVHGANRLGGNAVADITVFGRQAGKQAAQFALANGATELVMPKVESKKSTAGTASYKDGVYTKTAKGNNGDVTIEVTIKDGSIADVKATEHKETQALFDAVQKSLFPAIIEAQSADVDAVAGATKSSDAVLNCVKEILNEAK
ncbi:fumarate reductase flavoprotein subunit [Hydrogenoanaerobacterium saccharovorans]|uniref:Urocanate reductase n=1 Tax=Hydrogenoanaerobacterium saccharovorans TaxID=474960 RepID=A0A1H8ATX8_9FIRM|nr:flavocytochrome c [Hydrogenoanaerobacterium saccharovorans]RPF47750.1 fumarate reductase flavoprotein subunit [Hydrogenoanaerobacterium saccharovorans]SEM74145.1 fumarate reductase flavoprotein subunit [Hydrogenoanaerobacterium saccharovorans]